MTSIRPLAACLALLAPIPAAAAVSAASPSGFLVTIEAPAKAPARNVFAAIQQVGRWWDPQHTYSGNAGALSLEMRAGGCFCERWDTNSVEHARVLWVARDKTLRLEGSLGPLQELAVNGILQFSLEARGDDTALRLTYRVRGPAEAALDKQAAAVERVLAEQVRRLVRFVETGSPVPVVAPPPAQDQFFVSAGVRIRYIEEGKGADAVILLHDEGTNVESQWVETGIMAALAREQIFRVIAMDLRGHGRSDKASPAVGAEMARDVTRLMAHLGVRRAHVVGYGLGANIAAWLAAFHPERLITIALAGGAHVRPGTPGPRGELAVSDEEMRKVAVPALGLVGNNDPAVRDLVALRQVMPRLVRMVSFDGESHGSAPRSPEFSTALVYFLRYHPGTLVK